MCKKLRRSQRAGPISKIKIGLATLVGAGTGAWAYNSYVNKGWVYKQVKEQQRVMQKKKRPGLYSSNSNRSPYYPGYSSYLSNN